MSYQEMVDNMAAQLWQSHMADKLNIRLSYTDIAHSEDMNPQEVFTAGVKAAARVLGILTDQPGEWSDFVYAARVEGPDAAVKIGHSYDLPSRMKALQGHLPRHLGLTHVISLQSTAASEAGEKAVHEVLAHRRLRGEWFDVTDAEIEAAMQQLVNAGLARWVNK